MQLVAVRKDESRAGDRLIDDMHVLRAHVFRDRLGWDVTVEHGHERDEYDALDPVYIIAINEDGSGVAGCARLLPGGGSTMLRDTFPILLDGNPMPAHGGMVESSRFCVDTRQSGSASARGLHRTTLALFAGILEWSIVNSYSEVVTVTDLRFEKLLGRAGLPFQRLGSPRAIGNTVAIAGIVAATPEHAHRVQPVGHRPFCTEPMPLAA